MTTVSTEPDRDPCDWTLDEQLAAKAADAKPEQIIGRFHTTEGKPMAVISVGYWPLEGALDANDFAMKSEGWETLHRLIAFGEEDLRAYAVWEMYSRGEELVFRSKAIDVDCKHQKQGIGTGMRHVLAQHGWTIAPSGSATSAGEAFIRSWSRPPSVPAAVGNKEN